MVGPAGRINGQDRPYTRIYMRCCFSRPQTADPHGRTAPIRSSSSARTAPLRPTLRQNLRSVCSHPQTGKSTSSPLLSPIPKSTLPKYLNLIEFPLGFGQEAAKSANPWWPQPPLGSATRGRRARVAEGRLLVGPGALCVCWVRRWFLSGSQPWFVAFLFDLFI
jgi:hypothetical protein